ncbi:C-5 cytosine-specific DNA methylase [Microbacterium testaceum StLB037]|uniref:DNA (cytosine-5-)-methyltransferase n=1 Tax=Microbacterium testaceum (strain StLB037) TaxID=979556 RepID=A0A1H0LCT8_MICTS|nr:C-5 cytosine-specific DNA methylase [Microbacterium testaceum StLB037]
MHDPNDEHDDHRLRVGSLFSGYGGLDLAVEHVFDARTVWFSEINEPAARVFAHHWPDIPNLGDITAIDWSSVEPVDVLCGGFPCQDVSTVGKMAGLKPGTRSGLWAYMATAIDKLQPEWVVIENVRGLLSATAIRPSSKGDDRERRNRAPATPRTQPFAVGNPPRGVWETSQPDLYGHLAPYSETWPTSGTTRDGSPARPSGDPRTCVHGDHPRLPPPRRPAPRLRRRASQRVPLPLRTTPPRTPEHPAHAAPVMPNRGPEASPEAFWSPFGPLIHRTDPAASPATRRRVTLTGSGGPEGDQRKPLPETTKP